MNKFHIYSHSYVKDTVRLLLPSKKNMQIRKTAPVVKKSVKIMKQFCQTYVERSLERENTSLHYTSILRKQGVYTHRWMSPKTEKLLRFV